MAVLCLTSDGAVKCVVVVVVDVVAVEVEADDAAGTEFNCNWVDAMVDVIFADCCKLGIDVAEVIQAYQIIEK